MVCLDDPMASNGRLKGDSFGGRVNIPERSSLYETLSKLMAMVTDSLRISGIGVSR